MLTLLLALSLSLGAPVPKEVKNPPPAEITVGIYTIIYAGTDWTATLSPNGEFSEFVADSKNVWDGDWGWNSSTRTLSIGETPGEEFGWCRWSVVLDAKLTGKNNFGSTIEIKPFAPPKPMEGNK
jgi:hypothetical protein